MFGGSESLESDANNPLIPIRRTALLLLTIVILTPPVHAATTVAPRRDAEGPVWRGLGAQIYVYVMGGVDFRGLDPSEAYGRMRDELGIRYGRVMVRPDLQGFGAGAWDWSGPPSALDDNIWESLATMQASGIEPIVTPLFWPAGVIADRTFPSRDNNFLGTEEAYQNLVAWFEGMDEHAPVSGYVPRLAVIQNEPDNDDHLKLTPGQLVEATRRVTAVLRSRGSELRILGADCATTNQMTPYGNALLGVPQITGLAAFSYHTYGTDSRRTMVQSLGRAGLEFWMTEQAYNYLTEPFESWDYAEKVAVDFYRDVTAGQASAWFLWSFGVNGDKGILGPEGWRDYAAAIGLAGRHVPAGSRRNYQLETPSLRVLGWSTETAGWLWILNLTDEVETIELDSGVAEIVAATGVSAEDRFRPLNPANPFEAPANSASLLELRWTDSQPPTATPTPTASPTPTPSWTPTPSPVPTVSSQALDLDADGQVQAGDLLRIIEMKTADLEWPDVNQDGVRDFRDLFTVTPHWHNDAPPVP